MYILSTVLENDCYKRFYKLVMVRMEIRKVFLKVTRS